MIFLLFMEYGLLKIWSFVVFALNFFVHHVHLASVCLILHNSDSFVLPLLVALPWISFILFSWIFVMPASRAVSTSSWQSAYVLTLLIRLTWLNPSVLTFGQFCFWKFYCNYFLKERIIWILGSLCMHTVHIKIAILTLMIILLEFWTQIGVILFRYELKAYLRGKVEII